MATTAPSMEEITDTLNGLNVNDQLLTFTKYSVLVPELREHALSYAKLNDLKTYSQCSKLCNSEVQKYNTKVPSGLVVGDNREKQCVFVEVQYEQGVITKSFSYTGPNPLDDIYEYLLKMFRYVKEGNIKTVSVFMEKWPTKLMQLEKLLDAKIWRVSIDNSMWDDFLQFTKTTNMRSKDLKLIHGFHEQSVIPAYFFKSEFIKSLESLDIAPMMQIDKEDFVNSSWKWWFGHNWIDVDMIQEKFLKFIETNSEETFVLTITLPESENRLFDYDVLLPVDLFGERRNSCSCIKMGSSIYARISDGQKKIMIWYRNLP